MAIAGVRAPVALIAHADPASATPALCPPTFDWCVRDGDPGPDPGPGPGPGPIEEPRGCGVEWRTVDPPQRDDPPMWIGYDPPPPDMDVIWQATLCSFRLGLVFMYRWLPVVTPEIVANDLWVELSGTLPTPEIASDPAPGVHAIIDVPVYVEVTNWTGVLTPSQCEAGFCVTVTVTPSLVFRPGEPDSSAIACVGQGSRYDPNGPDIEDQAAEPGACSHAYRHRTGADGRPDAWPAEMAVTWTITWTSTAGNGGSLPSVTRSTASPRGVDEVQTVVVDGEER
jgi:hypothetical protein